jgi:hypothetical protein
LKTAEKIIEIYNGFSTFSINQPEYTGEDDFLKDLIEPMLYTDPQAQIPAAYCPVCGGAQYLPGLHCLRCERRRCLDPEGNE